MYDGNLRNALRGHDGLVVENSAEVIAVRENVGLKGQICTARVDYASIKRLEETHVNAGETVLFSNFLGA